MYIEYEDDALAFKGIQYYNKMSKEELDAEIKHLEKEMRIEREKQLVNV